MGGVLQGFSTIVVVVAVGSLLGHLRILDLAGARVLADLAFFVASPALLIVVLSNAPVAQVFSLPLVVAFSSALAVMLAAAAYARWRWRAGLGDATMAALAAGYVNSGNLGLPVAQYVLGDIAYAAPVLLMQLLVFTPASMSMLDSRVPGARRGIGPRLISLLRNPITVGALVGLVMSLTGWRLPDLLLTPVTLVGNLAVPCMLVAFGVALRLGERPGGDLGRVVPLVALKSAVQPVLAATLGAALGLQGHELFACVVLAALPTAQNIFTYALRYQREITLVRDVVFVTTLLALPVIFVVAVLFHV